MKAIVQAGRMVRAGGLLGFLLAMAACSGLDPIQKELDFGNVYVGTSFQQSTQWGRITIPTARATFSEG